MIDVLKFVRPSRLVRGKYFLGVILCLHPQDLRVILNFDIGYRVLQAILQHSRHYHKHQQTFTPPVCHNLSEPRAISSKANPDGRHMCPPLQCHVFPPEQQDKLKTLQ
jgi:hypothetical protein